MAHLELFDLPQPLKSWSVNYIDFPVIKMDIAMD